MAHTALKDRIQDALDEGRILVLGAQVILGLLYPSFFEPGYNRLPSVSRYFTLGALALIVIAFGVLMSPVAYHRIVEAGKDRRQFLSFVLAVMKVALLPFAASLGLTLYVATERLLGWPSGLAAGAAGALVAVFLWYGLGLVHGRQQIGPAVELSKQSEKRKMKQETEELNDQQAELKDKIRHVLTEARMVLPGAQALLGFQFITMMLENFDRLPEGLKRVHLVSLFLIAGATVLLMTPAAYHRIVEKGENTEEVHRVASSLVLWALVPLGLGITGDFLVVVYRVTHSMLIATACATLLLLFFYSLWFGFTFYRRRRSHISPLRRLDPPTPNHR